MAEPMDVEPPAPCHAKRRLLLDIYSSLAARDPGAFATQESTILYTCPPNCGHHAVRVSHPREILENACAPGCATCDRVRAYADARIEPAQERHNWRVCMILNFLNICYACRGLKFTA